MVCNASWGWEGDGSLLPAAGTQSSSWRCDREQTVVDDGWKRAEPFSTLRPRPDEASEQWYVRSRTRCRIQLSRFIDAMGPWVSSKVPVLGVSAGSNPNPAFGVGNVNGVPATAFGSNNFRADHKRGG